VKNETRYGVDKLAEKKSTIDDGVHFVSKGAYQEAEETAWRNNLGVWTKFWAK
jgi:endonuclease YncB( thermonuclease family)